MVSKVAMVELTEGTETSKYLEENKSIEILQVAASERRLDQTRVFTLWGCRTSICICDIKRISWEAEPERVKVSYLKVDQS